MVEHATTAELAEDIKQRIEAKLAEPSTSLAKALRLRIVLLASQKISLSKIAKTLAVSKVTVVRWLHTFRTGGLDALCEERHKLTAELSEDIKRRIETELAEPSTLPERALRLRIVLLASQKMTTPKIAKILEVSMSAIARCLSKFHKSGLDALYDERRAQKIELSEDSKRRIEAELAERFVAPERALRLRIVLLASQKMSNLKIAETLAVSTATVARCLQKFYTSGLDVLNDERHGAEIELSEDIKKRIEAELAEPSTPSEKALRLRMVLLAAQKMTGVKIAKTLATSRENVDKWLRKFRSGGLDALNGGPQGTKVKLTEEVKQRIAAELADPSTSPARALRLHIISLASQKMTTLMIAETLAILPSKVSKWLHEFHTGGLDALRGKSRKAPRYGANGE